MIRPTIKIGNVVTVERLCGAYTGEVMRIEHTLSGFIWRVHVRAHEDGKTYRVRRRSVSAETTP